MGCIRSFCISDPAPKCQAQGKKGKKDELLRADVSRMHLVPRSPASATLCLAVRRSWLLLAAADGEMEALSKITGNYAMAFRSLLSSRDTGKKGPAAEGEASLVIQTASVHSRRHHRLGRKPTRSGVVHWLWLADAPAPRPIRRYPCCV